MDKSGWTQRVLRGALLALLISSFSRAATLTGGDYAGADLAPANGDTLSGTFTNVGHFVVGAGTRAIVATETQLAIYAATITIQGTLDASGSGLRGGDGGATSSAGQAGTGASPTGLGGGGGGASAKGGGGAGHGGAGGAGSGTGGGSAGVVYGSTGVAVSSPISSDDVAFGSGGGGAGGGSSNLGGNGARSGGAIYLETSSFTISGRILSSGTAASTIAEGGFSTHPGAGGGGSGGGILLRLPSQASFIAGSLLGAAGGAGGHACMPNGGVYDPGGGGGGGRINIFYREATFNVAFSTPGGAAGSDAACGGASADAPAAAAGSAGVVSFGVIASSPTAFAAQGVYVTSINWNWSAVSSFGDAPAGSQKYRVFPATAAAPFTAPETSSLTPGTTVTGLTPNTTYYRFVTAFTDWGDSVPSSAVSTHTLASDPAPAAPAFSGMAETSLTFNWTSGSPANPSYTVYEVQRSTVANLSSAVSSSLLVATSSSPASLTPNTTYHLRVRAVNLDNAPSAFTAIQATATLAAAPSSPAAGTVYVTSAAFSWSGSGNPPDTPYTAQVSSNNFFTVAATSTTLNASATFFVLSPGSLFFFRVVAVNRNGVASAFSATISTVSGTVSDTTPPGAPGTPQADRQFSYDGVALFSWAQASASAGIFDYNLIVGSTPGGNDFFDGSVTVTSHTLTGLANGRTYYARARARSNAGIYGSFSDVSAGVPVFITAQSAAIPKPFSWPNPFDPARGPAQIGVFLEEPATVTLKIFSLEGDLVHESSHRLDSAGNQVLSWDGRNQGGVKVAPGGYVVLVVKRYAGRAATQKFKMAVLY